MQVFKRAGRPGYYARWQADGRDHVRATGETSRTKALEALHRFVGESRGDQNLALPFQQLHRLLDAPEVSPVAGQYLASARLILRRVVASLPAAEQARVRQNIVREFREAQQTRIKIQEGWQAWRASANRESEPKMRTLQGYEAMWRRFQKWAESAGVNHLDDVSRGNAESYAADLWNSGVSPSTFNQHIKLLRSVFQALENQAGLSGNPWAHLKSRKRSLDEGRRNLTEAELATVLSRAEGNLRLMLHIGIFTGLRLGDVVNLRWENIEYHPTLREARPGFIVLVPLKTSRYRKILEMPIHPVLREILQKHRALNPHAVQLFPEESKAYALNSANVSEPIQRFFESCGLETTEKAAHGHRRRAIVRVGFHSLRHSFVSLCAKAKTPLHVVQKLVGHGSPLLTSDVYLHLDAEQKLAAIQSFPTITLER